MKSPLIDYETIQTIEKIGRSPIHIVALKNLDQTLDHICDLYAPKTPADSEQLLRLCPYFGIIWPASRALATFIDERPALFSKRHGIEVGSGLALPSLVAARAGAQMHVTDFHPDVRSFVEQNAKLNQLHLTYTEWDWTDAKNPKRHSDELFDFVLASDVLYERAHPTDIARSLTRLLKPNGVLYLSDPGRVYLDVALNAIEQQGFHRIEHIYDVEETSSRVEHRLEKKRTAFVFEFIRNNP